ncbi:MAG: EAL domain-containing protein [Desulfuromonadaceae bacterium]|nr:EAL domain-containing protein [Desulfuromonadaceae bacterium]
MNPANSPIEKLILILAWGLSSLIAVVVPAAFFFVSHQSLKSSLISQTELTVSAVNGIILSNPKMWRFEEVRLSELLERRAMDEVQQVVQITGLSGELIATNSIHLSPPVTEYAREIHDAGAVIGRVTVARSLRPLLQRTAIITAGSIICSALMFFFFRALPLRVVKKAFQTLRESEKKYRSLYEAMNEGMALHHIVLDDRGSIATITVVDINPSFKSMFHERLGIVGSNSFELFGETFREYVSEHLLILGMGETISFELELPGTGNFYNVQAFSPDQGLIATLLEDVTESRKSEQQIQKMAYFDTLTGLPNRALFLDRINQALALADRDEAGLAVLFIDLDRFKNINDTLGHSVGDLLLIEVAQRLGQHLRISDTLARLGGDEFVVVITKLGEQMNVTSIAQKLIDSIQTPFDIKGNELHVSASIGIALYPEDGVTAENLIKHADMAMYSSKESGRNAYSFFSPAMNQKAIMRMEKETGLRHALERGEFFIELQPIICAVTGTVAAAEALVRWQHPVHGRIPPNDFIFLAEETGLILPLGEWVLRTVCSTMKTWSDAGLPLIRFCVNVSSRQIEQQNFPEVVRSVLLETGANAAQLEIELTESCLVTNFDGSIPDIFGMRDWGVTIAIDDFGTGYSSLGYIKTLPIDHIKIDKSFVDEISTNFQDQAIVEAIIAMSQKLGIRNIAEGVETREQLEFLQKQGCGEIQGYYFHRPLSLEAFETLLREQVE